MIKAIAIDDEPLGLEIIAHFCANQNIISLEKTFTQLSEAEKYLRKNPVDVLFLDIQMPEKSGIDFYRDLDYEPVLIFTTAYSEYAVEGFNINATDYLLKPFSEERFMAAIQKANAEVQVRRQFPTDNMLSIRAEHRWVRIPFDTIQLIEALDDYVQIHHNNGEKIISRMPMKNVIDRLPPADFLRVHRSYIVPVKRVKALKNKNLLVEGFVIPVGVTYEEQVMELFK
ncbi:MAG: DNA-binding response regulator [Flavobacterium sp. BFFFF2]|nr:MAG: DNA-binding response regulator [Flavobacterium sp. BFFFF2]